MQKKTAETSTPVEPVGRRVVYFDAKTSVEASLFERSTLKPGQTVVGPAVIDQLDSTTLIYPGDTARVDGAYNIIIELAGPA